MSRRLIDRSEDLQRLDADGYDIEVRGGYLLLHLPYADANRQLRSGTLVSSLTLANDVTVRPDTHVVDFAGDHPCHADGSEISQIKHSSGRRQLDEGLTVDHSFSHKPASGYSDYYEKMTTYAAIISGPARLLDSTATAQPFRVVKSDEADSVFQYDDTSSSRADINLIARKLRMGRVCIVGLGGTGSYVLDLIAKTPVGEIVLTDGDRFLQHNAFRAPGAPTTEQLSERPFKVDYFRAIYSRMHRNIVARAHYIDASNVSELLAMDFVFVCMDSGPGKRLVVETLESSNVRFIDVGMGLQRIDDSLVGVLRVTTSTPSSRERARVRIPLAEADAVNEYSRNIQIADLNALNAAFAVIRWKKLCGFYKDLEQEGNSTYTVDGNMVINDDLPRTG